MTTSSPEAKQPAKWYIDRTDLEAMQGLAHIIENGAVVCQIEYEKAKTVISFHNAATAKLREQIAELEHRQFCDHHPDSGLVPELRDQIAKLREELELVWGIIADSRLPWNLEANRRLKQLARQQPSDDEKKLSPASPPDGVNQSRWVEPDERLTEQPSTTTPDVEKIASNAVAQWCLASRNWTGYDMPDQQQRRLSEIMAQTIAQAREPLVADKKRLDWLQQNTVSICDHPYSAQAGDIYVNGKSYRASSLREAIDKALTLTEDKK